MALSSISVVINSSPPTLRTEGTANSITECCCGLNCTHPTTPFSGERHDWGSNDHLLRPGDLVRALQVHDRATAQGLGDIRRVDVYIDAKTIAVIEDAGYDVGN